VTAMLTARLVWDDSVLPRVRASVAVTCHLEYLSDDGTWRKKTTQKAGADGLSVFGKLEDGTYRVWSIGDQLAPAFGAPVALQKGQQASVSLEEGYGRVVNAWLIDPLGKPWPGYLEVAGSGFTVEADHGWLELRLSPKVTELVLTSSDTEPLTIETPPGKAFLGDIVVTPLPEGH
jgi:hypothetical protein